MNLSVKKGLTSEPKKGYTTGTCAQAAAKAAIIMLTSGKIIKTIEVETASGVIISLEVSKQEIGVDFVRCAVTKDSGDDPDVTNGAKIFAELRFSKESGIIIKGGEGVGRVTKPGLAVKVGEYAINPVPRQMILKEVLPYLPCLYNKDKKGFEVIISVPKGEELAKQTFNPRLGIVNGISILGTTGIVEPKSLAAYKVSLSLQLDVMRASGKTKAALVFGYVGERFCKEVLGVEDDIIIKIGDYAGFMLEECAHKGIAEVILAGHIGKLAKVANGQFNTHYQYGDNRIDTIAHYAFLCNASQEIIQELLAQKTAESTIEILKKYGLTGVFDKISEVVVAKINELVKNTLKINCYVLSLQGEILGSYLTFTENE